MSTSVVDRLIAAPPRPGHRVTFRGAGPAESFALEELYAMAGRLALHLRDRGIGPGDRIGVLASNCLEWVLIDLAALRLGALTAGFESGKFAPGRGLTQRYELMLLFTDEPVPETLQDPQVLPIGEARRLAGLPADGELPPVSFAPDAPTTLKFTSGSTGTPKAIAATAGSIDSSLRAVQEMFGHGPGDELFVFLPLSLLQQRYWIYSALCFDHDVTISSVASAVPALRQTRPTVVMGVPAFYELAKRHIEAKAAHADSSGHAEELRAAARRLFGPRVRYLWTGSAPARAGMLRFFADCGLPIYEGYGMNETCIVTKNHPAAHKEGSVGQVVSGKEILFDEHGNISVRSNFPVSLGYAYAEPGASERVFGPDGTVRTGDVGHLDEEDFLFVTGRADDVIALGNGRNIAVRPVEDRMRQSPAVEECVLFNPQGTELVAVVSPPEDEPDEAAIAAQLSSVNAQRAGHERISRVVVARPRFTIGGGLLSAQYKPLRPKIREAFRAQLEDSAAGIHACRPQDATTPTARPGPNTTGTSSMTTWHETTPATLENEHALLRPITEADRSALHAIALDPDIWRYFVSRVDSDKDFHAFFDAALADQDAGRRVVFLITDKRTGRSAGSMSIGNMAEADRRLEIGWSWLGRDFRGRGVNRWAKFLLLRHAFEILGAERVEFKTDVLNEQARHGLRNIGAVEEGTLRSYNFMPGGRRRDAVFYSVLHAEWPGVREQLLAGPKARTSDQA